MVARMGEVFTDPRQAPAGGLKPRLPVLQDRPSDNPWLTPALNSRESGQRSQRTGSSAILPCQLSTPSFGLGCLGASGSGQLGRTVSPVLLLLNRDTSYCKTKNEVWPSGTHHYAPYFDRGTWA